MWLIAGLGNPGPGYVGNRHNVGFMVLDRLAQRLQVDSWREKFSGQLVRVALKAEDAWLLKPTTYMNLSGESVQPCAAFYKIPLERIVVVHDELDLPLGTCRIKKGGGTGGHNGIRSLSERLGADFIRVRIGVGRPPPEYRGDVADYVLTNFRMEEREKLSESLKNAERSVIDIATRGLAAAMKRANTRPKKPKAAPPEKKEGEETEQPNGDEPRENGNPPSDGTPP